MRLDLENLPSDIDTLHQLVRDIASAVELHKDEIARLRQIIKQLQRAQFGRRSEKLDPDQLDLALEDIEQAAAGKEAADDKTDPAPAKTRADKRRANRGALPAHLPRVDVTIAPEDTDCPCCRSPMHMIGEETS